MPPSDQLVIPAFIKIHFCDHQHLQKIFASRPALMAFLPDQFTFNRAPKSLLFTVLYQEEQMMYLELKQTYKALKAEKTCPKIKGLFIEVSQDMLEFLKTFPDLDHTEVVKNSNFVKSSKRGNSIRGLMAMDDNSMN